MTAEELIIMLSSYSSPGLLSKACNKKKKKKKEGLHGGKLWHLVCGRREGRVQVGRLQRTVFPCTPKRH